MPWRTVRDWSGLLVAAAVVAAVGIYVVFWPVSDLIARHDVGAITGPHRAAALLAARDAVRARLLTLCAASFAGGALVYTAHNATLARRALELARRAVEIAGQGQVPDLYTAAIKQLGSDNLDVRIGGIYALERVAHDSRQYHPTVMEVLAAFIRVHSREQWPPADADAETPRWTKRPDVQAAVIVIGRRIHQPGQRGVSLAEADLSGARLYGMNLADDVLIAADLTRADLTRTDLARADLTGANLTGANLTGADLTGADLTDANLGVAWLINACLARADLTGADLASADLTGADLTSADLTSADLTSARWSSNAAVPAGWQRDTDSGVLKPTDSNPGRAPTDPAPVV